MTHVICSITPLGNVGNQMIQLMAAKTLEKFSGKVFSYNHFCPDFQYEFDRKLHEELISSEESFVIRDNNNYNFHEIAKKISDGEIKCVIIDGYVQKTEYFLDKKFYKDVFIIDDLENDISFNNNDILINIRAGEICNGIWAYPLIPFSFYKHIIDTTNYSPIFMGQIDDSLYIKDLKNNFPNATFLKSGGGKKDMARLRAAPRVCMTVSTFSWVNSYLSEAKEVHYPILGILHPNIMNGYNRCDINLLPINDSRYIYYLFPIIRGCKEDKYINEIEKIQPICKKIPTSMSVFLQKNKSLLKIDDSKEVDEVDEEFYLKNYIEASWEISQGLYKNSREHYNLIGKYRKYEPYEKLRISFYEENFKKIQDFLKVSQSSICDHSIGRNVEDDARNAIFGVNGSNYSFHTDFEEKPWWMIEFVKKQKIKAIFIYNRSDNIDCSFRLFPLSVQISQDGLNFNQIGRVDETHETVSIIRTHNIFTFEFPNAVECKFLRIINLKKMECLHLNKIDIYV